MARLTESSLLSTRPSIRCLTAVLALGLLGASRAGGQLSDSAVALPLSPGVIEVGRSEELGALLSAVVLANGDLVVADGTQQRILRYSVTGALVWAVGRKGRGPGEYQLPYRVGRTSSGAILVYDEGTREVTWLDESGRYLGRRSLSMPIRAVGTIVGLPNGRVALSGISRRPPGAGHAVHVFDSTLQHVRSFGELPPVRDPRKALFWGAGLVSLAEDGDVLFTRKLPYEVYKYSPSGELRFVRKAPHLIDKTPDDAFTITRKGDQLTTSSNTGVPFPRAAFELQGGYLLSGLTMDGERTWDIITPNGHFVSVKLPVTWKGVAGVDRQNQAIWMYGESDDVPVFFRVPLGKKRPNQAQH